LDIVAVDAGSNAYLFYVDDNNCLAYLKSSSARGTDPYTVHLLTTKSGNPIKVHTDNKEIAAITWTPENGKNADQVEVRADSALSISAFSILTSTRSECTMWANKNPSGRCARPGTKSGGKSSLRLLRDSRLIQDRVQFTARMWSTC
jgi:hypothetical protein